MNRSRTSTDALATVDLGGGAARAWIKHWLPRLGLLIALVVAIAVFSALRPNSFFTLDTFLAILQQSAPMVLVATGLTVAMVVDEFDLSVASVISLAGAVAIALMSFFGVNWIVAILAALVTGLLVGAVNGILTAYLGGASFITTLAMGTVLLGVEYTVTSQKTIFENIPEEYTLIGQSKSLGVANQVWIVLVIAILVHLLLERTEVGRYMRALGSNAEAAKYSGLAVRRLRLYGFLAAGLCAAATGVIVTSQAASHSPNMGTSYLLPAFAAVFLGSAAFRPGQFNIPGTALAVVFLQVLAVGLTLLHFTTALINIVQGVVLVVAVLVSRLGRST